MAEIQGWEQLLATCRSVASGTYSDDILMLTTDDQPEPVRELAEAMALMMVKVEAREYRLSLLVKELEAANERLRRSTIGTLSAMARSLAARDAYTQGHAERVADYAPALARKMALSDEQVEAIRVAGLLHDIGKIGFSDRLFQDHEGKNPPEVVAEIIKHPAHGAAILQDLDFLGDSLEFIHCHHERPDGKGYPRRLPGERVPLGARIVAVADGYDAMTTDRPYQKALSPERALEILRKHAGSKWDASCVEAFAEVLEERGLLA
jgi:putative nucleotidyltransferase with HDIG domain